MNSNITINETLAPPDLDVKVKDIKPPTVEENDNQMIIKRYPCWVNGHHCKVKLITKKDTGKQYVEVYWFADSRRAWYYDPVSEKIKKQINDWELKQSLTPKTLSTFNNLINEL